NIPAEALRGDQDGRHSRAVGRAHELDRFDVGDVIRPNSGWKSGFDPDRPTVSRIDRPETWRLVGAAEDVREPIALARPDRIRLGCERRKSDAGIRCQTLRLSA